MLILPIKIDWFSWSLWLLVSRLRGIFYLYMFFCSSYLFSLSLSSGLVQVFKWRCWFWGGHLISEQLSRNMRGNDSTEMTLLLCYKKYTNELEDYLSKKILSVNDCIYIMNMHFKLTSSEWVHTQLLSRTTCGNLLVLSLHKSYLPARSQHARYTQISSALYIL